MKITRPLKCVITAAAVCLLCFSGNGGYFFKVFALAPENGIADPSEQPDEVPDGYLRKICDRKKERLQNLKAKYFLYKYFISSQTVNCPGYPANDHNGCTKRFCDTGTNGLYDVFAGGLPGNRSP